jgi:dienelactone hydrolase
VWNDVFETFAADRSRVYVSGHSMGGFGTYLLTLLYPDRFAAGAPVAGPVTQGAWTGADFSGCDEMKFDEYTPCYIEANQSRPRDQHTRKLLDNALHVPLAILHGTDDELVPYSGVARQAERLAQLGYRFRFYSYPGYEHYSHPVMDQWADAARYLQSFSIPESPRRVVYKRDMKFEKATEEVQASGVGLDFSFDSAYWMSGLTPVDGDAGVAAFDGVSLAVEDAPYRAIPDASGPASAGATGPYVMAGQQWISDPTASPPPAQNAFDIGLAGARAVSLDLARMLIDPTSVVSGTVETEAPLTLGLEGGWIIAPEVTVDGGGVTVDLRDGVARFEVPAGIHDVQISPRVGQPSLAFTPASQSTGAYSDDAALAARAVDASGAPLEGVDVTFTLVGDGASFGSWSATTDAEGISQILATIGAPAGDYALTATAQAGDAALEVSTPFTVERETAIIDLSATGSGAKRRLVASVTDDDGSAVAGKEIAFYADGTLLGSARTGGDGVALFDPPPRYSGGTHTYTAAFGGDAFYRSASTG